MSEKVTYTNSGPGPLKVPGAGGVKLDDELDRNLRFAHGANEWKQHRLTAVEIEMLRLMDALTDKPNWIEKVFDDKIVGKWRQEALDMPLITEKTFDWCLLELRDKAETFKKTKFIHTLNTKAGCIKADSLIPVELQEELKKAVEPLLKAKEKDWHPSSEDKVLNLVHPSLFPLTYGKTRVITSGEQVDFDNILASCGKGEVLHPPELNPLDLSAKSYRWSLKFQWLPCEVKFSKPEGTDVVVTSYINNLHSSNKALYNVVQQLISLSIEPWNQILIKKWGRFPYRIQTGGAEFQEEFPDWAKSLPYDQGDDDYAKSLAKVTEYLELDSLSEPDDDLEEGWEDVYGLHYAVEWKWKTRRGIKHPEPGVVYTFEDWKKGKTDKKYYEPDVGWGAAARTHAYYDVNLQDTFREKGLQVIVKLASIELTPDKPSYDGGNWHLEGMLNEHIVATAIYYYDVDNVTGARVSFRQEAWLDDGLYYEQNDHHPLEQIFGTESLTEELAVQELGSIATPEGRLLVFPNVLQHRVEPFRLVDATRPGHRRFVVLWLVDPNYRIVSTANVPPQRHDWWAGEAYSKLKLESKLPKELEKMVRDDVGEWPMGLEEAKQLRLELMAERTTLMPSIEERIDTYNFCEH